MKTTKQSTYYECGFSIPAHQMHPGVVCRPVAHPSSPKLALACWDCIYHSDNSEPCPQVCSTLGKGKPEHTLEGILHEVWNCALLWVSVDGDNPGSFPEGWRSALQKFLVFAQKVDRRNKRIEEIFP